MGDLSFDLFHIFLFVIPGFITVWSFRYFAKLPKPRDFEYLSFSVFFGLVLLVVIQWLIGSAEFVKMIGNPYAASLVLSLFGGLGSWALNIGIEVADDIYINWRPGMRVLTAKGHGVYVRWSKRR
jgi:hypothetical protein